MIRMRNSAGSMRLLALSTPLRSPRLTNQDEKNDGGQRPGHDLQLIRREPAEIARDLG